MDKHERPYRCAAEGCEKLPGFTYSGGLLRHEREVHGKHGGPKNTVNCPYANCKRHTGKGFSRQENLNEHLRRVHTNDGVAFAAVAVGGVGKPDGSVGGLAGGGTASADDATTAPASDDDNGSDKAAAGQKRKRGRRDSSDMVEFREEVKRLRQENEELRQQMDRQTQHTLAMVAQIAELQEALRLNSLAGQSINAPTAPMM